MQKTRWIFGWGMQFLLGLSALGAAVAGEPAQNVKSDSVERWGVFESSFKGSEGENPFIDITLNAQFQHNDRIIKVHGFYDGNGNFKVRFMPDQEGYWIYITSSNRGELDGKKGTFICIPPSKGNHGPVVVRNTFHFAYADSTPFQPFGTTCYNWVHAHTDRQEKTIRSLSNSPFNKVRMILLPADVPKTGLFPYEGNPPNGWDFTRFNPAFFRHLEKRIEDLRDIGVEADIILFHPYGSDQFGFCGMRPESDERYLKYTVARLAAFRNVWWSIANEYDLLKAKQASEWDRFFKIVAETDPYKHLCSIHFSNVMYNYTNPLVSHASIQSQITLSDFGRAFILRDAYRKPVIYDEVGYEGNIESRWGRLTAEEMVLRFWQGAIAGVYVSHGETFGPDSLSWTGDGGRPIGESLERIAFLKKILGDAPGDGINPIDRWYRANPAGKPGEYYLFYFGRETPSVWTFDLPTKGTDIKNGTAFQVDIIDTWNMTVTQVKNVFRVKKKNRYSYICEDRPILALPSKPYLALRIRRVE